MPVHDRKIQGFTLIEILVVMVIIAIISGVILLTISTSPTKRFEYLANALNDLILTAEEEAILRPAIIGLGFSPTRYQFYIYSQDAKQKGWQRLTDSPFESQGFPPGTDLKLVINGKTVELNGKPQIVILTTGEVTPFTLFIGKKGEKPRYRVIGEADGNIKSELIHENAK